ERVLDRGIFSFGIVGFGIFSFGVHSHWAPSGPVCRDASAAPASCGNCLERSLRLSLIGSVGRPKVSTTRLMNFNVSYERRPRSMPHDVQSRGTFSHLPSAMRAVAHRHLHGVGVCTLSPTTGSVTCLTNKSGKALICLVVVLNNLAFAA